MLFEHRATTSGWVGVSGKFSGIPSNYYESLAHYLMTFEYEMGYYDLLRQGGDRSNPYSILTYRGSKPVQGNQLALNSYLRYNQRVAHLRAFLNSWDFSSAKYSLPDENPVYHNNLFGTVRSKGGGQQALRIPDETGHYDPFVVTPIYRGLSVQMLEGCPVVVEGDLVEYDTQLTGSMLLHIEHSKSAVDNGDCDYTNQDYRYFYWDFQYELNSYGDGISKLAYNTMLVYPPRNSNFIRVDAYAMKFSFRCVPVDFCQSGLNLLDEIAPCTVSIDADVLLYNTYYYYTTPVAAMKDECPQRLSFDDEWSNSGQGGSPLVLNGTSFLSSVPNLKSMVPSMIGFSPVPGDVVVTEPGRTFESFSASVQGLFRDAYPLNALSFNDAMETAYETVKSDHIEFISDLRDLMEIVDVVRALDALRRSPIKAIRALRKAPRLSIFHKLLNLLADSTLVYSLALAPTVSDATDTADKVGKIVAKYSDSAIWGKPQLANGKAWVTVPSDLMPAPFDGTICIARTKVRFSVDPDSYLSVCLPLKSLGLLPSLSSLWNNIPLSFTVDWVAHVGNSLEIIDNELLLLGANVQWSVNSVKFIYGFDDADMQDFSFDIISKDQVGNLRAGYSYYERYAMFSMPHVGPTRFPILGEFNPPWLTAGALAYKLFL